MYIVQYRENYSDGWIFTGREFSLEQREKAISSLKAAKYSFPDNQWRLVWVDINVILEDL